MREDPYVYGGSTDMELELEDRLRDKAGAGRGGQGGPTAKELADYERKMNRGIFTCIPLVLPLVAIPSADFV